MVHAIHSSPRHALHVHPDARRIAGLAAAITLDIALLMLLLVPMQGPTSLPALDPDPVFRWIVDAPKPPTPPIHVPVTTHRAPTHRPTAIPTPVAPIEVAPVVDHGDLQATLPDAHGTDRMPAVLPDTGGPPPGVTLEYADAPPPAYPRDALRDGVQGVVLLQVLVDVDGRPLQVDVQRSSGDRRLDVAARRQVLQHWRFRAAMKDGRAVQAIGLVPIAFNLDG
jgi:protein TonB